MGLNRVFLRSTDGGDVGVILSEAADFFNNFFSTSVKWNKEFVFRDCGCNVTDFDPRHYA